MINDCSEERAYVNGWRLVDVKVKGQTLTCDQLALSREVLNFTRRSESKETSASSERIRADSLSV